MTATVGTVSRVTLRWVVVLAVMLALLFGVLALSGPAPQPRPCRKTLAQYDKGPVTPCP